MRAHRARVHVPDDHKLSITLPPDFPTGAAQVIVVPVRAETDTHSRRLTVKEFLAARLVPPPGVGPVTLHDIEVAIATGALGGRGV